jgi:hypothetical protein
MAEGQELQSNHYIRRYSFGPNKNMMPKALRAILEDILPRRGKSSNNFLNFEKKFNLSFFFSFLINSMYDSARI